MGFLEIYPYVVLGIVFSVIIPILRQSLPKPAPQSKYDGKDFFDRIWPIAKPYIVLMIFSLIIGVFVVALSGDILADSTKALLAGFTWDSILQKAVPPKTQ